MITTEQEARDFSYAAGEPFNPSEWERGEHEPPAPRADGWIYGPRRHEVPK